MTNRRRRDQSLELRVSSNSDTSAESEEFIETTCLSSEKSTTSTPRKTVRFSSKVSVCPFKKLESIDHSDIWFSAEDLAEIRKECKFVIQCLTFENMQILLTDENSQYCGRGLEKMTPSEKKRRVAAKMQSRQAVIDEQWSQWYGGIYDEEAIAEKYRKCARSSVRFARIWALKDEREVNEMN
jgi:hypothetical protein